MTIGKCVLVVNDVDYFVVGRTVNLIGIYFITLCNSFFINNSFDSFIHTTLNNPSSHLFNIFFSLLLTNIIDSGQIQIASSTVDIKTMKINNGGFVAQNGSISILHFQ